MMVVGSGPNKGVNVAYNMLVSSHQTGCLTRLVPGKERPLALFLVERRVNSLYLTHAAQDIDN